MTTPIYKHEWMLDLAAWNTAPYRSLKLSVRMRQSSCGSYRAVLVDREEFRGEGSTQGLAIDDLATELEHVASEIRRSGSTDAFQRAVRCVLEDERREAPLKGHGE